MEAINNGEAMNATVEKLPCQKIHYLHCLRGGAADGDEIPSEHWYETLEVNGVTYVRDGEPVSFEPQGWRVLLCDDEYSEPLWMKAPMRLEHQ